VPSKSLFASLTAIAVGSLLVGCEPCSGMGPCFGNPHVSVVGVLRDDATGVPVGGAKLDLVRRGGIALVSDSVRTVTDSRGNFLLSVDALDSGQVAAEIVVRGPDRSGSPAFGYRIFDLRLNSLNVVGDAQVLLPWSTKPSQPDLAQLFRGGSPIPNAAVEFRRTGGVRLGEGDVFSTSTDEQAVCELLHFRGQPLDAGFIVGDLFVDGQLEVRGLRLPVTPAFRPSVILRPIDVAAAAAVLHR
jgi:hypothetical protein